MSQDGSDLPPIVAVSVSIYDERYTLHGRDPELMTQLAKYVDERMREVAEKLPTAQYQKLAVLTALNVAAELFKNRDGQEALDEGLGTLEKTSNDLLMLLSEWEPQAHDSSESSADT